MPAVGDAQPPHLEALEVVLHGLREEVGLVDCYLLQLLLVDLALLGQYTRVLAANETQVFQSDSGQSHFVVSNLGDPDMRKAAFFTTGP